MDTLPETKTTTVSLVFPNESSERTFILQEFPKLGATESVGFHLYEASVLLAQHLALELPPVSPSSSSSTALKKPKRILELGSGSCALAGIAATHLGHRVTFSDLPGILPTLAINVSRNAKDANLHQIAELKWGDREQADKVISASSEGDDATGEELFDLVIGADVVYQKEFIIPLLETISWCAKRDALICAEVRDESLVDEYFVNEAKKRGFNVKKFKSKTFPKPFCDPPKCEYMRLFKLQKSAGAKSSNKSATPSPSPTDLNQD